MKRLFTTAILVGFSAVSFANVEVNGPLDKKMFNKEVNENKSYYETLGDMFQVGSKPEASKLIGVLWSGRCFLKDEPYKPTNGAYHFRKKRYEDVGPLGNNAISYEAASIWRRSEAPNYFDDKDLSVLKSLKFVKFDYLKVNSNRDSFEIAPNEKVKSSLRVSGKYLIEELSILKEDVGPLGEGYQVWGRCYYFIPEYAR
tara:strand:- start:4132 stop:4731 length:600 start_codon:yes stop_codon:yes gene_type:complete